MNPFHRTHQQEEPQKDNIDQPSSTLMRLVANDQKMYLAMQNFLLLAPDRQIPQLGEVSSLLARGDTAKASGNNLEARADYETAAKIEIYNQNKESARSCLILAEAVSEEQQHHEFQETMLADIDEVLRISKAYQSSIPN